MVDELRKHDFSKQRRVSFEYILFDGVNDSMRHAVEAGENTERHRLSRQSDSLIYP